MKCYIIRQGWRLDTIKKLICKSFGETATDNANLARWDNMNGKLITGGVIKQVKHNAKLDVSFIDRSLGRTF